MPAPALETENDGSKKPSAPRFPTLISHFLVHAFRSLAQPANPLYADISRFLLQRPIFDAADVPMLFGMLYASGDSYKRDRSWIVRYIRDGTRCEAVSYDDSQWSRVSAQMLTLSSGLEVVEEKKDGRFASDDLQHRRGHQLQKAHPSSKSRFECGMVKRQKTHTGYRLSSKSPCYGLQHCLLHIGRDSSHGSLHNGSQ